MLFSLLYAVAHLLLDVLIVRSRPKAGLEAEALALRHQLRVLERQIGRPRWQPADRLLLAAISRVLPRPDWQSLLPSPQTLLRWHQELVRRKWAAYRRRPRRQRPAPSSELHELILKLARENERWGYRRIAGELLKLGHRCSHLTVRKVLRRHSLPPAPGRAQDGELGAKKFLLRDRDTKFTAAFDEVFRSEGIEVVRLPYRAPRANSVAERFVGTARRECLDHLLIFGRRHLEGVLTELVDHYHRARPHQGLDQRLPWPPADVIPLPTGPVERRDRLGGLLHEYLRAA